MLIQYLEIMSGKLCNLLWLTFKNLFYFDCLYVCGWVGCAHKCRSIQKVGEGNGILGTGVTEGSNLPSLGAGD